MLHLFYSIILLIILCTPAKAATGLYDEGVLKGYINAINCVGSDITCTFSGITGTFTLAGATTVTGWTKTGTVIAQTVSTDTVSITGSTTISTGASTPLTLDTSGSVNFDMKLNGTRLFYDGSIIGFGGRFFPAGSITFWSEETLETYIAFTGSTNLLQMVSTSFEITGSNVYIDTCPNATYLYTGASGIVVCGTATLVTTADTGTVTGTMIANDTVALTTDTSGNYVATITATKETGLASSGSCGSEGCASTLQFDYTQTGASNPTMATRAWIPGQNMIIFEGTTADTNEGQLTVSEPTGGDKTWTLPNTTGTLVTTGDSGTVTGTMVLDNTIALTTDTAGNYVATVSTSTTTGLNGGAAGSEGTAISLAFDYTNTLAGNPALSASTEVFGTTGLIFEGSTADTNELLLTVADPTADRTITIPASASGTIAATPFTLPTGANTACSTTCGTLTCVHGWDTAITEVAVLCSDATADKCLCGN